MQVNQGKKIKNSQKNNDFSEYMWYNRTNKMGGYV